MRFRRLRKGRSLGKKGASMIVMLRAFDLVLAAGLIVIMILFWRNAKDDTFMEKSFIARDVGMLLAAAYASPGELTYCYYEVGNFNFDYNIQNSKIVVEDEVGKAKDEIGRVTYRYAEDAKKPLTPLVEKHLDSQPIVAFEITKNDAGVKIVAKRKGDPSDTCQT